MVKPLPVAAMTGGFVCGTPRGNPSLNPSKGMRVRRLRHSDLVARVEPSSVGGWMEPFLFGIPGGSPLLSHPLIGDVGTVTSVALSPDGKTIFSSDDIGTIRLWDRDGYLLGQPFTGHDKGVYSAQLAPMAKPLSVVAMTRQFACGTRMAIPSVSPLKDIKVRSIQWHGVQTAKPLSVVARTRQFACGIALASPSVNPLKDIQLRSRQWLLAPMVKPLSVVAMTRQFACGILQAIPSVNPLRDIETGSCPWLQLGRRNDRQRWLCRETSPVGSLWQSHRSTLQRA